MLHFGLVAYISESGECHFRDAFERESTANEAERRGTKVLEATTLSPPNYL